MTLIEDRTFVINQNSPFVDTIMHSINYTNALGDAIRRVRASGIRDQYVDFTVDIRSDSKQIRCLIILHFTGWHSFRKY